MSLTVSQVRSWKPDALRSTQAALVEVVRRVDGQRASVLEEQDALADSWGGDAANAAAARIVTECSRMGHVAGHLEVLGAAYETAAGMLEGAKEHVEFEVSAATSSSFDVNDQGVANADALVALLPATATRGEQARDLRHAAAEQSVRIAEALRQAAETAAEAASRLDEPTLQLAKLGLENPPGRFVENAEGVFTWKPDIPATTAASVISGMTTSVTEGLKNAAAGSVDDVARNIGRGFGAFGAVLGTVPAIKNDIDGGMDVTQAVVTTSAGTVVGTALAYGAAFSVVPGFGTGAGIAVGLIVGGVTAYGVSKGSQAIWRTL